MTLFKTVHKRYTSFAEDLEENDFSAGTVGFGQKVSANVSRYGDLVTDMFMEVALPPIEAAATVTNAEGVEVADADKAAYWVNAIGYALISEIQIEIGGTEVDTLYPEWMFFWESMTQRPGARLGEQIGKFAYSADVEEDMIEFAQQARTLYVPLPFWFNKYFMETGLSIPLIALTYHEIKVKVTFRPLSECCCVVYRAEDETHGEYFALAEGKTPVNTTSGSTLVSSDMDAKLLISYVYLDKAERDAFASTEHSYLITRTQRQLHAITSAGSASDQIKLYFNHPSNCLAWFVRPTDWTTNRRRFSVGHMDSFDFSLHTDSDVSVWGDVIDPVKSASLNLNGHSRFPDGMPGLFFRQTQPIMKWPNCSDGFMYVFSFSLQGGAWQPTSTLNMSRIDHVQLELKYGSNIPTSDVFVFAESYNLLVVKDGMGGVRYSN
ncbi:putative major capsid protein [Feldmannia species virus]|uniref:Putative major capsid protein n=1 Tax=Feldmannia species virus TaxID=39420 RepID=B5LWE8_9PHYC|nr:putative major capsid protein [Feldmannia species virus]ACH46811.1 putative major capsid protein [Feldmannia species virus]